MGLAIGLFSCNKASDTTVGPASGTINVTNAVIGGATITLLTNNDIISTSNTLGNNAAGFFPLASGSLPITLGVPAIAATVTTAAIPQVTYYTNTLAVNNTSNYSLFLTGTSPNSVDNVLIQESYPRAYADSTCGVRFINLSPGSNPISVNIKGNANGSEVASLAYKAYSGFIKYPAKAVNKTILFEVRDATTGALLLPATSNGNVYTLTVPYFHNVTLCYRGTGTAVGIILDADY